MELQPELLYVQKQLRCSDEVLILKNVLEKKENLVYFLNVQFIIKIQKKVIIEFIFQNYLWLYFNLLFLSICILLCYIKLDFNIF